MDTVEALIDSIRGGTYITRCGRLPFETLMSHVLIDELPLVMCQDLLDLSLNTCKPLNAVVESRRGTHRDRVALAFWFIGVRCWWFVCILGIRVEVGVANGEVRGRRPNFILLYRGSKWDVDKFGSGNNSLFTTSDCDFVHNLTLVQRDVGDNIWSGPLSWLGWWL